MEVPGRLEGVLIAQLVLIEAVEHGEILPLYVSEKLMVADPFTKYLPFPVWVRHMRYLLCIPADREW